MKEKNDGKSVPTKKFEWCKKLLGKVKLAKKYNLVKKHKIGNKAKKGNGVTTLSPLTDE